MNLEMCTVFPLLCCEISTAYTYWNICWNATQYAAIVLAFSSLLYFKYIQKKRNIVIYLKKHSVFSTVSLFVWTHVLFPTASKMPLSIQSYSCQLRKNSLSVGLSETVFIYFSFFFERHFSDIENFLSLLLFFLHFFLVSLSLPPAIFILYIVPLLPGSLLILIDISHLKSSGGH